MVPESDVKHIDANANAAMALVPAGKEVITAYSPLPHYRVSQVTSGSVVSSPPHNDWTGIIQFRGQRWHGTCKRNVDVRAGDCMTVASIDLCKTLFFDSGWIGTTLNHFRFHDGEESIEARPISGYMSAKGTPAYDLGYLLRSFRRPRPSGSAPRKVPQKSTRLSQPFVTAS